MNRFVIVTPGRCGSTYLCRLLNQHPDIECEQEVFNRSRRDVASFIGFCNQRFNYRMLSKVFNRERMLRLRGNFVLPFLWKQFLKNKTTGVYGFKITVDQLEAYPGLFDFLNKHYKIIYLTRRDVLRRTLSLMKSRESGNYDSFDSQTIRFDVNEVLEKHFALWSWEEKWLKELSHPLVLIAEDLFARPKEMVHELLSFLSLDAQRIAFNKECPTKLNPEHTRDWVSNYDDILRPVQEMQL